MKPCPVCDMPAGFHDDCIHAQHTIPPELLMETSTARKERENTERRRQWNSTLPAPTKTLGREVPVRREADRPSLPSPKKVKRSNASRKGIIPNGLRSEVKARADGRCEACGRWMATTHLHHRKLRSQGGQNTLENLIAIHLTCHLVIHEQMPRVLAEEYGYIVPEHDDPAEVDVIVSLAPFELYEANVKAGMA